MALLVGAVVRILSSVAVDRLADLLGEALHVLRRRG